MNDAYEFLVRVLLNVRLMNLFFGSHALYVGVFSKRKETVLTMMVVAVAQ